MAALLAGGAALVAPGETAGAAFPGNNGEVAFVGTRNGSPGVYATQPNGSSAGKMVCSEFTLGSDRRCIATISTSVREEPTCRLVGG